MHLAQTEVCCMYKIHYALQREKKTFFVLLVIFYTDYMLKQYYF